MPIRERKARLEGLKMCFIGDGNNMVNSLIVGCLKVGMNVSVACPEGYDPHPDVMEFAKSVTDATFTLTRDPMEAAKGADVVFTDVWASMGQEEEKAIRELNVGVYVFESGPLWEAIDQLRPNNAQGEYYLTDAPAYILSRGGRVGACPTCTAEEMLGVNTVEQLAQVEELVRRREGLK